MARIGKPFVIPPCKSAHERWSKEWFEDASENRAGHLRGLPILRFVVADGYATYVVESKARKDGGTNYTLRHVQSEESDNYRVVDAYIRGLRAIDILVLLRSQGLFGRG